MFEFLEKIQEKISGYITSAKKAFNKTYNKHTLYMYITLSIIVTLIIEAMARGSLFKGIVFLISSPYIFICNALIILMSYSITLLVRRRFFGLSVITFIWIVAGVANAVLLANRVTPLTASDIFNVSDGIAVMGKYFKIWQIVLSSIVFLLAVAFLVFLFIKAPKIVEKVKYIRTVIAIAVIWPLGFGAIALGLSANLIAENFGNLRDCYAEYGFVYCFTNSIFNTGISRPDNYSDETINRLIDNEGDEKKVKDKPNIIMIQLESFYNLNTMKNLTFSEEPQPVFNKMLNECASGYFGVPIVGAGTVNTEFEVMTGMNLDDFGPGEYPFKTCLLDNTCESICFNLKNYGYKTHAIHNNTATFYGRNVVFSNLGYDTFASKETMNITEFTPMEWAKDFCLTDEIMDTLKSTKKQDYIYTISVQGHGSYPTDGDYDYPIKVSGLDDEALTNQFQYYAWQVNEMDQFIGQLVEELKNFDEHTILVMYGDHLPSLGVTSEDIENGDVYQTQYFIWSNYKTNYTDEDIEAYQLQSKILNKLNMTEGNINNYTQKYLYGKEDIDEEEYLNGLKNLSYDQLYGDEMASGGVNPYTATDIQFGLHPVKLKSVVPITAEKKVYLYGKNFTQYSVVYINDEKYETIFIDPNTIAVEYPDLKSGDVFSVHQQNSEKHMLTKTDDYVYAEDEDAQVNKNANGKGTNKKGKNKKKKSKKKSK